VPEDGVAIPATGPVLGLDHGDARIGVAICDPDQRVAVPVGTVHTGAPADLKAIAALARAHGAVGIVVGLPLSMSGASGVRAAHARSFAEALRGFLPVPVQMQDERLSTVEAERELTRAGVSGRQRRAASDQASATVILQAWIDRRGGGAADRGGEG
jgi:putative Holliday junction resolvase